MEDRIFDALLEELRALRIRETAIIEQLEEVNRTRASVPRETAANEGGREATADRRLLRKGDRVRIKNKMRKPATAGDSWSEPRERLATVTSVTKDQVHIVTDNGTKTWRAPNNLQLTEHQ